ncbi:MAG: acyltransferase [Bacteroidetes bacterium]|nr:acyltransferase [Bacteroidota bacterium]
MKNSFLTNDEIGQLGLLSVGNNVKISRFAQFYGSNITIGSNVRIDDFCILSGTITIGSFIHISAYTALFGSHGIEIADFSGISPRCTIFSASDDFSGNYFIGPMISSKYTNIKGGLVKIGKYVQIGAGCIVFPSIIIEEGVAVGSMSLVNKDLHEWSIYAGIPVRRIKDREKGLLKYQHLISED